MNRTLNALSLWACLSGTPAALAADSEFAKEIHDEQRTVTSFCADEKDINKVLHWDLGTDDDLCSAKELCRIALKKITADHSNCNHVVSGIDWRRSSPSGIWMAHVYFLESVKLAEGSLVRSEPQVVEVFLLPNGAPVKQISRPMTPVEVKQAGLEK